ncbi:RNA-binding S4 domain-containing protein [Rhodanobacter spathiphylli]|uniref:Heat shock protein 15 n=2 Tax=Rhodanobacter TaxID=75309 RepID=I4W453_9GAMM|nr:ribosome-associated heat shock protein [Rhodanobacter spathiphylli B39]
MGAMNQSPIPAPATTRVDVWLWAARFFKTRSLAKQAIDGGRIDVNDAGCKPARTLHAGDRLKISRGDERMEVEVLALSDRRGPASAAQLLYRETEPSRIAREAARELHRLTGASGPPKRPDKQARRDLRRLKHEH